MVGLFINVLYDFWLSKIEILGIKDAISEIQMKLEQEGVSEDLKFRLFGKTAFFSGDKAFSANRLLESAKSFSVNGDNDVVDASDLARIIREEPFLNKNALTLMFTTRQIATPLSSDAECRYRFSDDRICIFSMAPYYEDRLTSNDEYRVIKLAIWKELGLLLGAMSHRREKIIWNNGTMACTSELCALNRTNSMIQKMVLAEMLDSAHVVYCPYCLGNIKRFYHLPANTTQP